MCRRAAQAFCAWTGGWARGPTLKTPTLSAIASTCRLSWRLSPPPNSGGPRAGNLFAVDAQSLVHDGRSGGVLHKLAYVGVDVFLHRKGRQRGFMKARQDELLLAGVGVDVADGKHAFNGRLEFFRVDRNLFSFQVQAPVGNGPQIG